MSCTFAGYRFVFETREHIEDLISRIDQAVKEYERGDAAVSAASGGSTSASD